MSANPLVAEREDTTSPFAGAGLLEDGADLCSAVESGSWLQGGLAVVSTGIDVAAMVSDPLGSLIAAGLGWLMDHLSPLNEWLEDLTGDADQVRAFAKTWANVGTRLQECGQALGDKVNADLVDVYGAAAKAYREFTGDSIDHLVSAATWAGAISTGLEIAATIVQVVHDLVRDTLAQLVGSIISWVAELVFTVGLATPLVIEQVTTRVASLAKKLGTSITDLVGSLKKLGSLLDSLKALFKRGQDLFDGILTGARRGADAAGDAARAGGNAADAAGDAARAGGNAADSAADAAGDAARAGGGGGGAGTRPPDLGGPTSPPPLAGGAHAGAGAADDAADAAGDAARAGGDAADDAGDVADDAARAGDDAADGADDAARAGDDATDGADDAADAADAAADAGKPLPDISDIPHPKDGGDLDAWATEVAARHGDLTPDEVKGIYRYTTNDGYTEMNSLLRGGSYSPADAARIQKDIDDAVSGMAKLPHVDTMTYRGTNLPDVVMNQVRIGEKFPDTAFQSTSFSETIAHEFRNGGNTLLEVHGTSGVDVQALSHYGREAEVLMPPTANLVVTGMRPSPDGLYTIITVVEQ